MRFRASVYVALKPAVNDPQGNAVMDGLRALGFHTAANVRVGKYLTLDLEADDHAAAQQQAESMCDRLLANPVIETYTVEVAADSEEERVGTFKGNKGNLMQHWTLCEILSIANCHHTALNYIDAHAMAPLAATRKDKDGVFSEMRNNLAMGQSVYAKAWASLAPPRSDAYPNSANFVQHLWRGDLSMLLCEYDKNIAAALNGWLPQVKAQLQDRLRYGKVHQGDWRDRFSERLPSSVDDALTLVSFDPDIISNSHKRGNRNLHPQDLDAIGQALKKIEGAVIVQISTYSANGPNPQPVITSLVDKSLRVYGFRRAAKTRTDGHMMSLVYTRGVNAELTRALKALGNRFDTWLRAHRP